MEGMLGNMLEPTPTESAYEFSGFMVMEIVNTDKKGKSEKARPDAVHAFQKS